MGTVGRVLQFRVLDGYSDFIEYYKLAGEDRQVREVIVELRFDKFIQPQQTEEAPGHATETKEHSRLIQIINVKPKTWSSEPAGHLPCHGVRNMKILYDVPSDPSPCIPVHIAGCDQLSNYYVFHSDLASTSIHGVFYSSTSTSLMCCTPGVTER